jgi:hypothetical protein
MKEDYLQECNHMAKNISELIMEFFEKHPHKELEHGGPVVDWVTEQ